MSCLARQRRSGATTAIRLMIFLPISDYLMGGVSSAARLVVGSKPRAVGGRMMVLFGSPKRRSVPSRRLALAGIVLITITVIAAGLTIRDRREETIASYRRE